MPLSIELEKLLPPRYEVDDVTYHEEEEEEEEALSLCDLPVSKGDEDQGKQDETRKGEVDDFDFDFGSLIGSVTALESEMCTADEVFSGGQMLPFRHSVSSDVGLSRLRVPNRGVSRSVSMDRSRFGSCSSSRSSSTRSHQSNASTSTTTSSSSSDISNRIKAMGVPNPKPLNQFHSYRSPKARIQTSSGARLSTSTISSPSKSTMWQILRLGLVRTPEIELQGRTSIHINKSSNRFSMGNEGFNNNSNKHSTKISDVLFEMPRRNNQLSDEKNRSTGGFFKSCKCGVGAIEPLPTTRASGNCNTKMANSKSLASQALNEDKDLAQRKQQEQNTTKQLRQGKHGMSHHRTFEWLRDLSHPSILNS